MDETAFIGFHVPVELREALERIAQAEQRTLSGMLRYILIDWVARRAEPPQEKST